MKIPLVLFVVIIGCCAKENLHGTSFLFSSSPIAKVVLKPTISEPLRNITICLQSYTDFIHKDSLFKLETKNSYPFHLFQISDYYYIRIDRDQVYFKTSKESMEWRLICVSWESSTGVIHFVVNGKLFPRKVLKPGFIIDSEVTAILGHNIGFSDIRLGMAEPSYVGEIRKVNMWDQALHPSEMQSMYFNNCYNCNGSVISWESVDYEIYGDVLLYKPSKKP
ncbi:C-reactive protein-like [Bufo gargarizans]|uniref:C-reactive protein-like n=1 Tax=Bufo gargarizans TaxID=30331 RepID=UPI001CF25574|nr:C-reactive protein-like [Bufo gargarizans]